MEELWREILPDDFIERPRKSRIFFRNKLYSYPLRAFETLANLGVLESALCVASYLKARLLPTREPASFHQWVANQFGERLFRIFFKTYTEKVWGMSCDEISADWAAQRIKGLNLFVAVVSAVRKSMHLGEGKSGSVKTLIESFRYPRRGPGMVWEAAAQKIRENGGIIIQGQSARRFAWDDVAEVWSVAAQDRVSMSERTYRARRIISSAPLRDVVNSISPRPASAEMASTLKYRDFLTVAIFLKTPALFDDNWIYIHDPNVKVGRVQNYASWSPEMLPTSGGGCLGLEYFCFEGDGLWNTRDADLIQLAINELKTLGLVTADQVGGGYVVRQPKAYPVYDAAYKATVDAVRAEFAVRFPTFYFVGRNGMHKYNNQDHAMMTAMLTARNIIAGSNIHDVWSVNEDAEYHEEVTEDAGKGASGLRLVPQPLDS